jgi:hypothetical protein
MEVYMSDSLNPKKDSKLAAEGEKSSSLIEPKGRIPVDFGLFLSPPGVSKKDFISALRKEIAATPLKTAGAGKTSFDFNSLFGTPAGCSKDEFWSDLLKNFADDRSIPKDYEFILVNNCAEPEKRIAEHFKDLKFDHIFINPLTALQLKEIFASQVERGALTLSPGKTMADIEEAIAAKGTDMAEGMRGMIKTLESQNIISKTRKPGKPGL